MLAWISLVCLKEGVSSPLGADSYCEPQTSHVPLSHSWAPASSDLNRKCNRHLAGKDIPWSHSAEPSRCQTVVKASPTANRARTPAITWALGCPPLGSSFHNPRSSRLGSQPWNKSLYTKSLLYPQRGKVGIGQVHVKES